MATTPNEFKGGIGEMAVLLYVITKKHKEGLMRIYEELFTEQLHKDIYNEYVKRGIVNYELFLQHLTDLKRVDLVKLLDESKAFGHGSFVMDDDDLSEWIDTLEDYYVKRRLCSVVNDVTKKLDDQEPSSRIIDYMDKSMGGLFIKKSSSVYSTNDKIMKVINEAPVLGVATGLPDFDLATGGLVKGGLLSIGGVTGNLKSTSALNIMRNMLRVNPLFKGVMFEIEMSGQETAISILGQLGINRTKLIKGEIDVNLIKDVTDNDPLKDRFTFYTSDNDGINTMADITKTVLKERPDVWCVDYMGQLILNESMINKRSSDKHNMYFMETMHSLKILAQRTNSIGIIIHQADAKANKYRKDPRPKIEDIEWSQDIVRLSSAIYMCYYPCKYFRSTDMDMYRKVFIQLWHKMRFANSNFNVMEVDPVTGIFRSPTPRVAQMAMSHMNNLDNFKGDQNG
jgi:replicative DNA helicase